MPLRVDPYPRWALVPVNACNGPPLDVRNSQPIVGGALRLDAGVSGFDQCPVLWRYLAAESVPRYSGDCLLYTSDAADE